MCFHTFYQTIISVAVDHYLLHLLGRPLCSTHGIKLCGNLLSRPPLFLDCDGVGSFGLNCPVLLYQVKKDDPVGSRQVSSPCCLVQFFVFHLSIQHSLTTRHYCMTYTGIAMGCAVCAMHKGPAVRWPLYRGISFLLFNTE